jgi:NAD+ diphosphatase
MKLAETVTFGGGGLNRDEDLRRHPDRLAELRPTGRVLLMWKGKPLLEGTRDALAWVPVTHPLAQVDGTEAFVGTDAQGAMFARDLSGWSPEGAEDARIGGFVDPSEQGHPDLPEGTAFCELRAVMTQLSPLDAEVAAAARAVLEWHRSHGFCSRCGGPTAVQKAGWQRTCTACGAAHFPRTDPVVIMLVTHGNSVLVGRSHGWPEGMYSLLAGFIDAGETLEAAVRREVWEEAGVRVGAVRYLASQPWPFPMSLMFGCHGEALESQITVDIEEIEDAVWVTREDMVAVFAGDRADMTPARKGSIAHFLLQNWLADRLD